MEIKKNKILVQIGTNTGDDTFNKIVKKSHPKKVILVEPNVSLNPLIQTNYKGVPNVSIENVAITDEEISSVELVIPSADKNGRSVNGVRYNHKHFSLLPMDDWGDDFIMIRAPGITLHSLCEKHGIKHIHFLQIDTEGYDSEIIRSINFSKIKIDIIQYERWEFGEDCFKRYGDKGKLYGKNAMALIDCLLVERGYVLEFGKHNIIAVKK